MLAEFKDHFSRQSDAYATYRPSYPDELFRLLASSVVDNGTAWDCATGNGQAAVALADYFPFVVASDASQSQINAALTHPNVEYRVATAEMSGLADHSIDLITVGQAFHWFNHDDFLAEAKRVLKPRGVLAIWCYGLCSVTDECDAHIITLYRDIVGEYWPPERVMIEQGYAGVVLPGAPIATPTLEMSLEWRVEDVLGFLRTWSACNRYELANRRDPVADIEAALRAAWGEQERRVTWPLHIKVSRVNTLLE